MKRKSFKRTGIPYTKILERRFRIKEYGSIEVWNKINKGIKKYKKRMYWNKILQRE